MAGVIKEQLLVDGVSSVASLSPAGLLQWSGARSGSLVLADDVLGIVKGQSTITLNTFQLTVPGCTDCGGGHPRRVRKDIVLTFSDQEAHHTWFEAIQRCLGSSGRPTRLMVFVNPFGGKRGAKDVFFRTVEPMFRAAGISIVMRETQFQHHAKDLAKSIDISQFDGVVCVSGDGVLVEVLNGLLERADWERAIKLPLGIIPAGSGNGMAKSVLSQAGEPCDAAAATFAIIRGHTRALDVATVSQGQAKFHSLLMLTWGLVADVDVESERFRWLGSLRFDVQTLCRLLFLRQYNGSFAYIPEPGSEGTGEVYSAEQDERGLLSKRVEASDQERSWRKNGYSGPLVPTEGAEWRTMEGSFVLLWLLNVPWASTDAQPAPLAEFSDGCLDLLVVRDVPRWTLLSMLLGLRKGTHIKSKYVEYLKVKALRLAPGGIVGSSGKGGYLDLDGEVLARGEGSLGDSSSDPMVYGPTIEVTVEKGLATIFCPPS